MPEPMKLSNLEENIKEVVNIPEPNAEFLDSLRVRFIAEGSASAKINLETQMKKKIFSNRLTWVFVAFALVILVVIFTRPTVVNALKRLFGYVPNIGIIDQTSQIRVLLEPVSITRDNVNVTVEQAILNHEKTIIVYTYTLPPDYVYDSKNAIWDQRSPFISLPDGTHLEINTGRHTNSMDCPTCFIRYMMEFAPIPDNVNEAVLEIPSLVALPVGEAPQDWEIPLKFRAADADDIIPVFEQVVTPVETLNHNEEPTRDANPYGIQIVMDKFVSLPDGYIIYGNTSWTDTSIPPYGVNAVLASMKDANGEDILFDYADTGIFPQTNELREYWAYQIRQTDIATPVTLSFVVLASIPADGGSFTFNFDTNPQQWQKFDINQDVTVNNETIHVLSAEYAGEGAFLFTMQSDSNIVGASLIDLTYPPMGGGGGGGSLPEAKLPFYTNYVYQFPLPPSPLTLTFTNVQIIVHGDWVLTWSP